MDAIQEANEEEEKGISPRFNQPVVSYNACTITINGVDYEIE